MAGQVVLVTTKELRCQKITVEPIGFAYVFFLLSIDHGHPRGFSNSEKYFKKLFTLYESETETLKPGRYTYPFRFVFPLNCVPSFVDPKGKGKVKYELIATMHLRRARKVKVQQILTVCPLIDLEANFELNRPILLETCKTDLEVTVSTFGRF
uniref:Arrestin-like N-terminal domain-containing protein n=1 Tax=Panagrolaimus sp. ES5 TaxID=591445 RepID=A0AC34FFE3_9BILA